jgi:hypothetical protein
MNRAFRHFVGGATFAVTLTILPTLVFAESTGSGSYITADATAKFTNVYAYRVVDLDDTSKVYTEVLLAEKPLNTAAVAEGLRKRDGGTASVMWEKVEGAFVKLELQENDYVNLYAYVPPGYNFNYGGTGVQLSVNTPTRVEGSFNLDDTDSDGKPRKIDLKFAADVAPAETPSAASKSADGNAGESTAASDADNSVDDSDAVAKGDPLPADGGEPGKAFLAAMDATRAGDVDKMLSLSTSEARTKMLAERAKPEFNDTVKLMQQMTPAKTPVTGGWVDGNNATVLFEGQYEDGSRSKGTAILQLEEGAWRLQKVDEKLGALGKQ